MIFAGDNALKKILIIGDKVLIKPTKGEEKTKSGLLLPPGVREKDQVLKGYVMKTGPGYVLPVPVENEAWKPEDEQIKYIPLQAKEGDLAIFLVNAATEIKYEHEKYFIVPHNAILLLERAEDLEF